MLVNEIKHYFNPEQLDSYSVSWWKEDRAFEKIKKIYADSEDVDHLFKQPRRWLNLGIADDKNVQTYSMTQDNDTIYVFLQSVKGNYSSSSIEEFRSFEAAQEFVANHILTKASHIEDAKYRVADESTLLSMRTMIKNLKNETFYI